MERDGQTMKWNKSFSQIYENGVVGDCPYCGSADTDYIYWEKKNGRGSLNVWCNSCGECVHADCGFIPKNHKCVNLGEEFEPQRKASTLLRTLRTLRTS